VVVYVPPSKLTAVQVVDEVGVSETSWRDAVWQAVSRVLNPTRHVAGLEVVRSETANRDGKAEFRVTVKIAYTTGPGDRKSIRRRTRSPATTMS
jgi:flavin-binding protein dodecin